MLSEADRTLRDHEIRALVRILVERREQVVDGVVDHIQSEIPFYRSGTVAREDLWRSCDVNIQNILAPLTGDSTVDLSSPRETGRRRATQHAPLPAVMAAYRIGFRHLWDLMVTEARDRGVASSDALVTAAPCGRPTTFTRRR